MIEKILLKYLENKFKNEEVEVPVYPEEPAENPDTFILIENTGGTEVNFIKSALVSVRSFSGTMHDAAQLNEKIIALMKEAGAMDEICSVRLNSFYPYNDTTEKRYCYQAVFDVYYY